MPANLPLVAVTVSSREDEQEHYAIGAAGVTAVVWHEQSGHMAMIPTVRVYVQGALYSEHPFHNIVGVYYDKEPRR